MFFQYKPKKNALWEGVVREIIFFSCWVIYFFIAYGEFRVAD
jgi:hypothetical protein